MVEAGINCAAEQIVEFTAYGRHLVRSGNRSADAAPQGLYACRGVERWLALSVATDEQWVALCGVLGWEPDPALATAAARHAAHDALDERLAAWAADQEVEDAVDRLVAAGVPAVVAWDPRRQSEHPHLVGRGLYEQVPHPVVGTQPIPGLPYRWSGIDRWARTPSPLLGEHSRHVLTRVLGMSDADIDALEAEGVIGYAPTGGA